MKRDLRLGVLRRTGRPLTVAATATALIALAACSPDSADKADSALSDSAAMTNYAADTTFKASAPVKFSMLWTDWPENPVKPSWQIFEEIKKRTNVSLDLTNIPFSDAKQKQGLLISSGDAPQIVPLVYTGDEQQYAATGSVLPMSDYVKYMPNFQKYVKEWDLQKMIDNLRQADGKYYMLPGLQEVSVPTFTLVIRKDIFEQAGAGVPQTWDELRAALVKIKAKYPDSKPSQTASRVRRCSTTRLTRSAPSPVGASATAPSSTRRAASSSTPPRRPATRPWSSTSTAWPLTVCSTPSRSRRRTTVPAP